MNKQIFDLLRQIINKRGNPVSVDDLSASMHVSTRMIYNYWKDICFYCKRINAKDIVSFNDSSFAFNGDKEDAQYINAYLDSLMFNEYRLNSEERIQMIIVILAYSNCSIKSSYFEEVMFASKNTIVSDIKEVKELLVKKGIHFDKNKHSGLLLECDEKQRFELIVEAMENLDVINEHYLSNPCNPAVSYLMNYLKLDKYRNIVEQMIKETENEINCKVSDYSYFYLVFVISLFYANYEAGHIIVDSKTVEEETNFFASKLSSKVARLVADARFNTAYIYDHIVNKQIGLRANREKNNPKHINEIVVTLLKRTSSYYNVKLEDDNVLIDYLNAHISACYHRIYNQEVLDNPYLEEIKRKYPEDFDNLKNNVYLIENGLNISLNDGEIAYVLLHILASVERNKGITNVPTIALVCASGLATSNFLAEQLKLRFKIKLIVIKSAHDIEDALKKENIKLIVSTIPVNYYDIPVIQVNAILQDEDYLKIIKALDTNEINNTDSDEQNELPTSNILASLLDEKRIKCNVEVSDWKEAIIKSAEDLLWDDMITPNYVHQMINLVMKYGPYVVISNGVALAHAAPTDGVIKPAASLIRLKKPVKFGKEEFDPVSVVICCAIEDTPLYVNALMQLLTIIKNPAFMERVNSAVSAKQIYEFFVERRVANTVEE